MNSILGRIRQAWFPASLVALLTGALGASAVDITIYDGQSTGSGWYSSRENNETEPGTITSQAWDLETMSISGTQLTITGGYDFRTGTYSGGKWYRRGDILIDLNGDAKTLWTSGVTSDRTKNSYFNYDFAIHFSTDPNDLSYTIVDLNQNSLYQQVTDIQKSNPWRLDDNYLTGSYIDGKSGTFNADFETLTPDSEGNHYALTVDLANYQPLLDAIKAANEMLIKYTIECGNDTILGLASVPSLELATAVADSGTTLVLLGLGFGGMALFGSRFGRRSMAR